MTFTLPELPYAPEALEPHIDAQTMTIHHGKHHAGYVAKLNDALSAHNIKETSLESLLKNLDQLPEAARGAVRNNGGGHYNHSLFWKVLSPKGGGEPTGDVATKITDSFGSFNSFKEEFAQAAATRFGSGWAWLCLKSDGGLCVCSSPNQDNPLIKGCCSEACTPILGLDVWEHAYYLNYQNRRPDYISAFWNIVNWDQVNQNLSKA